MMFKAGLLEIVSDALHSLELDVIWAAVTAVTNIEGGIRVAIHASDLQIAGLLFT